MEFNFSVHRRDAEYEEDSYFMFAVERTANIKSSFLCDLCDSSDSGR
jgi:hypothetical protein